MDDMDLQLYELVTSDICKLVYGFLLDIDLFHIAVEFLNNSQYLIEFAKARKQNKMFIHKVNGLTLQQWLAKASLVYSVENYVDQKCLQFKIDKMKMKDKNLLEQIDFIFQHVQKRAKQSRKTVCSSHNKCKAQPYVNAKIPIDEDYDENLFKNLTEKDKKILVDVLESKDTVSEHLAQKISEELNKRPCQGSPNINDLAHQVAQNTVSDDIFHDLCAEMYEEGFLSESLSAKYRSPRKPTLSPLKSPSTPARGSKSSPIKAEVCTPSSQLASQTDMRSPLSQSSAGMSSQPINSNDQTITRIPSSSTNQPLNSSMVDRSGSGNSTVVEVAGDKSYHVMRPMSVISDVSSVASASSLDTSISTSTHSMYASGLPGAPGLGRYTVLPPPPTPTSHHSPPTSTSQFIMPLHQSTQVTNLGQPTSLILLPVVSQGNLIVQPSNPTLKPQAIAPLTLTTPSFSSFQSMVNSPMSTSSVLNPFQQRYAKVKPKHPRSKHAKDNTQPYSITIHVPAQNGNVVPTKTLENEDVLSESNFNSVQKQNQTKADDGTNDKTFTLEPKQVVNEKSSTNTVSDSPYKLDTFISFNDSNLDQTQAANKDLPTESINSLVQFNYRITHGTPDTTVPNSGNTPGSTISILPASLSITNEDTVNLENGNCIDQQKTDEKISDSTMVIEEIPHVRNGTSQDMDVGNDLKLNKEKTSPKITKTSQDEPIQDNDQIGSTVKDHEIPAVSIEENHICLRTKKNSQHDIDDLKTRDAQITNETLEPNTEGVETNENPAEENDNILDDSVKLIIINGDEELPLNNEVYDICPEINPTNKLTMNTVVVINEEPCTETFIMESNRVNLEVVCHDDTQPGSERVEADKIVCTGKTAIEISDGEQKKVPPETSNEEKDTNIKEFYLIHEPRHVYEVVNNSKDVYDTLNKLKNNDVPSSKHLTKKSKTKTSTRKQKVIEKKGKSSPEVSKAKSKGAKPSPCALKDTLYSKITSSDGIEPLSSKQNNVSLDFLNYSCKVTPAVKVLSTPKRKSSSTPRRSHVRALKFETPLKPTGLKRKCNTSPKECKNQVPFTFERVEKPKNVSRNLCDDVEMKKDAVVEKTPWDLGLRQLVKYPDSSKLSPNEIAKGRKRNLGRKKSPKKNQKTRKKRGGSMKTIAEELNNSHDNAKCSLDETVVDTSKENVHYSEESKTTRETIETDFKSNEGSCLSLNVEDTPLKIADFQDDIHESLKTPSKGLLFPSRSLSFTPIDNIIRNNLGESESLLKIIEDINMFKETPIKEALENLSDKSKTPSPQKSREECLRLTQDKTSPNQDEKSRSSNKTAKSKKNKRKVSNPKISVEPENDCGRLSNTQPSDNSFESSAIKSRKNTKQNLKQVEAVQKPVRRSLRSNSSLNKNKCMDPFEKDNMNSTSNEESEQKDVQKKRNLIEQSKENENADSLSQSSDVIKKAQPVKSSQCMSEPSSYSICSDKDKSNLNNDDKNHASSVIADITENDGKIKDQRSHLTQEKYKNISTFLDDCLSENEKLKQHTLSVSNEAMRFKENTRKRSSSDTLEEEDLRNLKKKKKHDNENMTNVTSGSQSGDVLSSKTEIVFNSPDIANHDIKQSENSNRQKSPPLKLKLEHMKETPKKIISNLCEKGTNETDRTDKDQKSPELGENNLKDSDRIDSQPINSDTYVQMIENSDYPLNLSTGSSNKENSPTIDMNVTDRTNDTVPTPFKETSFSSHDDKRICLSESIEIDSCNNKSFSVNGFANIENSNVDIRHSDVDMTANGTISEDESEDAEETKVFIYVSHKDVNGKHKEAPRSKELTDVVKNFNWTLEVDIGVKLDLSTFSHNIVNLEPEPKVE